MANGGSFRRNPRRHVRRASRWNETQWAGRPAQSADAETRSIRPDPDAEVNDLRVGPHSRVLRYARDSRDRTRRGEERLPILVDRRGNRYERAVSNGAT